MTPIQTSSGTAPMRVVVIDDNPDDRAEVRRMLLRGSGRRYVFEEAETGANAIRLLGATGEAPYCVLLDYDLPDMTAPDVLRAVAGSDGLTPSPMVVLTGTDSTTYGQQVLRSGAQDYIGKEWMTPVALTRAMENAVERWRSDRALRQAARRDTFLLAVAKATRSLTETAEIKLTVATMLASYLGASQVLYLKVLAGGEVRADHGHFDGVPPVQGRYRLTDCPAHLRTPLESGASLVVEDVAALAGPSAPGWAWLERGAHLSVPVLWNGLLVGILNVAHAQPRQWDAEEVKLVEHVAEHVLAAVKRAQSDASHRESEAALQRSEARLKQVIELMPSFSAILRGPDLVFEYANKPYFDLTGHGSEIIGRPLVEAMPEVRDQPYPGLMREVMRTGTPFQASAMPRRRKAGGNAGEEQFLDLVYLPLQGGAGTAPGILVHGIDRTEQVRAERALRRSERDLQALADNVPDVLSRFDRDLRHVFINASVESITGMKKADFIGRTNRELGMPPALCDLWEEAMRRVFASGEHASINFSCEGPDGMRHFNSQLVAETGADGSVDSLLVVAHDTTQQIRSEQALADQDRRKDEFLATLAHELRNPLAPVRTGLHVLQRSQDPATMQRTLAMMERQLAQMVRLIDDLLDISRINSGKLMLHKARVSLQSAAETAAEAARPFVDAGQHLLEVRMPQQPVWIDADATRIAQVIGNLLTNSARYTPTGGRISLAVTQQGDTALLEVTDNGVGIPAEMLGKVFDMFTQVNRPGEREQGGLGIGLSLVKRLVELHQGSVAVSSGPGQAGSTFTVRLPVAPPETTREAPTPPAANAAMAGCRVLVVDDNADAADTMAMMLELSGCVASTALNGRDALAAAQQQVPDVMFLDIGLPDMSGYDVARELRARPEGDSIVLIALTGWGADEDRRKSREAGFDLHLVKPVDAEVIAQVIGRWAAADRTPMVKDVSR